MPELSHAVQRARLQLMLRHPYLASAVARLPLHIVNDRHWCTTAATDGYNVFLAQGFTERLSEPELMGLLAHEVLHCVFGHMDRRGSRQPDLWNRAADFATNLLLTDEGFTLPEGGLLDRRFFGDTAEEIYAELLGHSPEELERLFPGHTLDSHLAPGDLEGSDFRGPDFPSEAERRRLREGLAQELKTKLRGREAGAFAEEIAQASNPQVPWQALLDRFFTGLRRDDYRTFPFNKKHIWRGLCLPSAGRPGPEHLVMAVDTSGSMTAEELGMAVAELDSLRSLADCRLTLIQCDAEVQEVREFEAWESPAPCQPVTFRGRGGTSFLPPFRWVEEQVATGMRLDALIYLTDGYGDFPKAPPAYPCLWLTTRAGAEAFPFGEVIRLSSGLG